MYDKILAAAVQIAASRGLAKLTRLSVAKRIGCALSLVSYYFEDMPGLKKAVVAHAVETENLPILAGAIMLRYKGVEAIPKALKERALLSAA